MIQFGNNKIKEIYVGSDKIKEVYYGSKKVWGKIASIQDGYWVHKDTGVKTYFGTDADFITGGIMSQPSWATNASEVHIPSGVTELANYCFSGCTSLTSVTLPAGITSLGTNCFYQCTSLTSITLPESVTHIGEGSFANCYALILLTVLPAIPPTLGANALLNVSSSINIKVYSPYVDDYKTAPVWIWYADKISAIEGIASYWIDNYNNTHYFESYNTPISNFYGWATSSVIINGETVNKDNVKEIHFGDSYANVTSIDDYFLRSFTKASVINLSGLSNVTSVGNYFLENARSITSMDLSIFNLNSIGRHFMSGCTILTSINLSGLNNVTNIGNSFLEWCRGLISIDLSPLSNVTTIGDYFLYQCFKIESIDISPLSNVTSIGGYFLGSFIEITDIDLSPLSNVTNIGFAFLTNNRKLSDVDLSPLSNLTNIGHRFLYSCVNLNRVVMGSIIPPILGDNPLGNSPNGSDNPFYESDNLSVIEVPCGSEDAYKTADKWSDFSDIIEGDC